MDGIFGGYLRQGLMASAAIVCMASATPAIAQTRTFNVPEQEAASGVAAFARQADIQLLISARAARGRRTNSVRGDFSVADGLQRLLANSGLRAQATGAQTYSVVPITLGAQSAPSSTGGSPGSGEAEAGGAAADSGSAEIVVTGTNIRGVQPTGSPLVQIDRRQIQNSGLGTTQEVIRTVPQNFGGGASEGTMFTIRDSAASNVTAGAGINLRGLGNDSTLVLINGQRVAPGGVGGGFVDVSMIPVSAIARIDVLTDSSSAIYGSDAVGGVVNIILDDRYSGFETGIRAGFATQGGAETMQASQSAGTQWSSGRASIHYEYRWADRVDVSQREFSAAAAGPTDLIPRQERQSIFAAISQNVGEGARLFAQGFISTSDSDYTLNNPRAPSRRQFDSNSSARQISGSIGFTIPASNDLAIDGNFAYSRMNTHRDQFRSGVSNGFNDVVSQAAFANLKLSGGLFELPGGTANGAIGAEYRRETFFNRAQEAVIGIAAPNQSRNIVAGFGEVYLPLISPRSNVALVNELRLSAAARYERYSDAGEAFSPRVGMDWIPMEGLRLRGSIGRSFRAPLLSELDTSLRQALLIFLPNPAAPAGQTLTLVPSSAPAPDLGPERATIWSIGTDIEPNFVTGLRISATYFNINFRDRITVVTGLFRAFLDPAFAPVITLNPSGAQIADAISNLGFPLDNFTSFQPEDAEAIFDQRTLNIARTRSQGVDASIAYGRSFGDMRVAASANATFLFKRDDQISNVSQPINTAGTVFNPADFRLRAGLNLVRRRASLNIFANHVGALVDNQTPGLARAKIPSWTTFDVNISYEFPEDARTMRGLRISLSVQNLFDRDPPLVVDLGNSAQSLGYDGTNANPLGRVVSLSLRKAW